ncbi:MAG TPA: transcription antitermination factor NusB [Pelagibacteraceae bacterium]|jgi:N utilization substance protein B|nr:transcription antitermination factor NusB [Pelagibacteraceae bacterium]|tara:strand:- start:2978 stop:3373 length:396 start_codon:yes stop_codon:yes gene_type:complete
MKNRDLSKNNPRIIVIQKLYSQEFNNDSDLVFTKHRYKKFIKDVVLGTLERKELIEKTIRQYLGEDLNKKRTEKLLLILLHAATFELLYRPETSVNIIINEYLNTSDFFLEQSQKKYLNAILDKISKEIRS